MQKIRSGNINRNQYLLIACSLLVVCTIITFFVTVYSIYLPLKNLTIPFDTDEADHANAAIELYQSIRSGLWNNIVYAFQRQAFYPPLHSIGTAFVYFIFSPSWFSSRLPSLLFFVITACLLTICTYRASRSLHKNYLEQLFATSITTLGFITSNIIIVHSALSMLELCGVFTISLCLYYLTKHEEDILYSRSKAFIFAVLCFLIFLAKYNFAIISIPGLFFAFLTPRERPYFGSSAIYAGIAVILLCAGWIFASSPTSFVSFLTGHPSYVPLLSAENIFFELNSWLFEYSVHPIAAALFLVLAFIGAKNYHLPSVRASIGIILNSFVILFLSTTNETRHFMVAAPAIFFLAGLGAVSIIESSLARVAPLASGIIVTLLCLTLNTYSLNLIPRKIAKEMEGKPEYGRLQNFIVESIRPSGPTLFIGATDDFSIEGLQWIGAATWNLPYSKIEFDSFPFRADKDLTAQKRKRNRDYPFENLSYPKEPLEAVIRENHYKNIVTVRTLGSRDKTFETIKSAGELLKGSSQLRMQLVDKEVRIFSLDTSASE